MTDEDELFATNVRIAREARGLSQQELADRLGDDFPATRQVIWKIENGSRRVSVGEALRIANALDLGGVDELLDAAFAPRPKDLQEAFGIVAWGDHIGFENLDARGKRQYDHAVHQIEDAAEFAQD